MFFPASHCHLVLFPTEIDKKMVPFLRNELSVSSEGSVTLMILQVDLASLCLKAGVKNLSTVFLMTDAHVADERFLVLINDLLASGKKVFTLGYH